MPCTGGNPDAIGNAGPWLPGGGAWKNRVNSPPCGWLSGGGASEGVWKVCVNSPPRVGAGAAGGQSADGVDGMAAWNIRVNSPGPLGAAGGGGEYGAGSAIGADAA